ncbi:mRNA cap guanine-N7 methyltransferase [Dimargaris xerosporica]|nr:mRNA cap guanine-N7 methyltransferase [Dimargaris xerosporica]
MSARSGNSTPSSGSVVADHYNARPELGRERRNQSDIIGLRKYNNWVKTILIGGYSRPGDCVLDLGCGKGGDLLKWNNASISYYLGLDIAQVSVQQARERYRDLRNARFKAEFHAIDCFGTPIQPVVPPRFSADIVSIQFCMHYAFSTRETACQMLENATAYLRPGGHIIATIPNANWLVKKVRSVPDLAFGNSIYTVKFKTKDQFSGFGDTYSFALQDAIDDCPEYLIHLPTLEDLGRQYNLRLVKARPFHEFYRDYLDNPELVRLLYRMHVLGPNGESMSAEEWEAVGLYMAVVFRKSD